MDVLRATAEQVLRQQLFQNRPSEYEVIEISSSDLTGPHFSKRAVPVAELNRRTSEWIGTESTKPSLKLVRLDFESAGRQRLYTTADDILQLFHCFELDTYMLYMICRDIMGFHQVSFHRSVRRGDETIFNFFVNIEPLKVVWSFNTSNLTTQGIVLTRVTPAGRNSFQKVSELLSQYRCLMTHPLFITFATVLEVVDFVYRTVTMQGESVSRTEARTGFSPWSLDVSRNLSTELNKFSRMSQEMGGTIVELEGVLRFVKSTRQTIMSLGEEGKHDWLTYMSEADKTRIQDIGRNISEVLCLIQPQLDCTELHIDCLRERAKNQVTVIFNLITRGDAMVNIDLVRSAKDDGSSMKVIAIMTMAFLPSTFFAALFSVPSLQWNSSPVIQDNFWVYWAFTVPCTTVVFLLWLTFTRIDPYTLVFGPKQKRRSAEAQMRPRWGISLRRKEITTGIERYT